MLDCYKLSPKLYPKSIHGFLKKKQKNPKYSAPRVSKGINDPFREEVMIQPVIHRITIEFS
jgi:hypothetical protein